MGKVTFLDLFPLTFPEFLEAIGEERVLSFLSSLGADDEIPEVIHSKVLGFMREYFVVGGMPEVVDAYCDGRSQMNSAFGRARELQLDLLDAYVRDFAKYADSARTDRILAVFNAIPAQLAKDTTKFVPSKVISSGRYAQLESAIDWLIGAGLVHKVPIANSGEQPLSAFTKENRFKLYLFDIGLLGALGGLSPQALYLENELFATFKGAFCENFIAQEFIGAGSGPLFAWANNTAEVEFLRTVKSQVLPVEVKAGKSGKLKSLNVFSDKYNPPYRTRFSARNLEVNNQAAMHSYPLYLAFRFPLA